MATEMNQGFVRMFEGNYAKAAKHFGSVCKEDPKNPVASNNHAICLLYDGGLTKALLSLEKFVTKKMEGVHEGVVFNLCTMYELGSSDAAGKKRAPLPIVLSRASEAFSGDALKL